jgi:hypothetical protein
MLEWRYIPFHVHTAIATEMAQTGRGGTGMAPPANWFVVAPPGAAALPVVAGASRVDRWAAAKLIVTATANDTSTGRTADITCAARGTAGRVGITEIS